MAKGKKKKGRKKKKGIILRLYNNKIYIVNGNESCSRRKQFGNFFLILEREGRERERVHE